MFVSNTKKLQKNTLGFTLIELLVVVTIIIVLTTVAAVSYRSASMNGRDAKRKSDLETVRQALVLYRSDQGSYIPGNSIDDLVDELNTQGYLSENSSRFQDPGKTNTYYYLSDGFEFTLTATLENPKPGESNPYTLKNP